MGSLALYQNGILCRFQEIAARENSGSVSPSRCPFYNLNFLKIWIDSPKRQPPNLSKHRLITSKKSWLNFSFLTQVVPLFLSMVQLHLSFTLQWCGCTFLSLSNGVATSFFHSPMVQLHFSYPSQRCSCTFFFSLNGPD